MLEGMERKDRYDVALRMAQTIIGAVTLILGVLAFVFTVKPAFDRDKARLDRDKAIAEMAVARDELRKTVAEHNTLIKETIALRDRATRSERERDVLEQHTEQLKGDLQAKENRLKGLLDERGDPAIAAILISLQFMTDDVLDEYLLHTWQDRGPESLLKDVAQTVAEKHEKRAGDAFTREAVQIFKEFVKNKVPTDCRDWKSIFDVTTEYFVALQMRELKNESQQAHGTLR